MEKDVTEKQETSQDLQALRDENRRLYELVERLIATQESEQAHRNAIEAEIQEMKLALVEQSAGGSAADSANAPDLSAQFEQLLKDFGAGLEDKLTARIGAAEDRLTLLAETHSGEIPGDPEASDKLANATWKMIAPLGDELERLSGMITDLRKRVDEVGEDSKQNTLGLTKDVESLLAAAKQANEAALARTAEAGAGDARVDEFTRSLEALEARQSETQERAVSRLSDLFDAQAERLRSDWASQMAVVKTALGELAPKETAADGEPASDPAVREDVPATDDQEQGKRDATQNVVAGDFPAFQRSVSDAAKMNETADDAAEPNKLDMTRKLRSEATRSEGMSSAKAETDTIERTYAPDDPESGDRESDLDSEDALLTEPADWRTELDSEEEALVLSHPILPEGHGPEGHGPEGPGPEGPGTSEDQMPALRSEPLSEETGPRKVDLRAFKDLRLSGEPDRKDDPADLRELTAREVAEGKGDPYENAPAEASLTRFVRLIRSRKRSSPS